MEYIKQTAVVVTIDTVTIATGRAVKSSINISRKRTVRVPALLRVGTQATEEAVLNPDGSRVTKAVGVVGSLQSCVIEESKAISKGTILDKIIDG